MKDTWVSRDLPVLDATVSLVDEGILLPEATDIHERSSLEMADVGRALIALNGEYLELQLSGGYPSAWYVRELTSGARRAIGQWPSPEGIVDALAEAFGNAAGREPDPGKKNWLRQVGTFVGTTGRDVATEVVSKLILRSAGMGAEKGKTVLAAQVGSSAMAMPSNQRVVDRSSDVLTSLVSTDYGASSCPAGNRVHPA